MSIDLQRLADQLAVREVSIRYNRHADAEEREQVAALFVEDGVLEIADHSIYKGRDEIATAVFQHIAHITTDPLVELDGDTARQTSRLLVFNFSPEGAGVDFITTGHYIDDLVRTPDGWRFTKRRIETDLSFDRLIEVYGSPTWA